MKAKSLTISILILAVVAYVAFLLIKKNINLDSITNTITATEEDIQSGPDGEKLSGIMEILAKDGYYNNGDSNQLGLGFLVQNSSGMSLGVSPFYNSAKNSTRYYLNETASYEIYDSIEITDSYHQCAIKDSKIYNPIIVTHTGDFPNTFKITKAYGVNFDLRKFIEIDPNTVVCYPPDIE